MRINLFKVLLKNAEIKYLNFAQSSIQIENRLNKILARTHAHAHAFQDFFRKRFNILF
jgi:hypothetical protein